MAQGVLSHKRHKSGRMKTICTSAVLAAFGIDESTYHYASCREDVVRVLRSHGWSARSRKSRLPKACTIGRLRTWLRKHGELGTRYYASVPGHAMLLDSSGATVVDTDPRTRDRRRVLGIAQVRRPTYQLKL